MMYVAYQIWLFRNNLIFEAEIVLVHWMLESAFCLAMQYSHFDIPGSSLDVLIS